MSNLPPRKSGSASPQLPQTVIDKVLARVSDAALTVDQRSQATRPRTSPRRPVPLDRLAADTTRTPEQVREARSLRLVFSEFGDSYREFRRRTGAPVSADVRDAATRFRRELSVNSLATVAARLEELQIAW
ncbi:MAG TPA: hypothetical protein VHL81_09720 [Gemmatimonadales bacterium]|jgi:hypothetical protein|nr:hypothetical protein [Gemmatimonadales bacterium]